MPQTSHRNETTVSVEMQAEVTVDDSLVNDDTKPALVATHDTEGEEQFSVWNRDKQIVVADDSTAIWAIRAVQKCGWHVVYHSPVYDPPERLEDELDHDYPPHPRLRPDDVYSDDLLPDGKFWHECGICSMPHVLSEEDDAYFCWYAESEGWNGTAVLIA